MKPERIEERELLFALECDGCGRRVVVAVQVGEIQDYESHTATLCRDCLLALVRAAWNMPYLHLTRWQAGSETLWVVADEDAEPLWPGLTGAKFFAELTEAEALISALRGAP